MTASPPVAVLCNGATLPKKGSRRFSQRIKLFDYREDAAHRNIKLGLPRFIKQLLHIPPRLLDLLELAAYVFCADRSLYRGEKDTVEYQSWSRDIHVYMKVREPSFWNQSVIKTKIRDALCFMTGDRDWNFDFQGGHSTPPTDLFDRKEFLIEQAKDIDVILFSGGLDSLAGALSQLESSEDRVCLVSHRSGNPGTKLTQDRLFQGLADRFHGRVFHYPFECSLSKVRADDESQRTRSFLYSAIAFVLAHIVDHDRFFIYENGITSINLIRRQDAINARTSRTTHPKTLSLLQGFISEVAETAVKIENPFFMKTKTDIFKLAGESRAHDLISSSVSCSKTYNSTGQATHCGGCLQCVDRRFAAYGSECDDIDEAGIYSSDFIRERIGDGEVKTTVVDYVRQAHDFLQSSLDKFYRERLTELADIAGAIPGVDEEKTAETVFELFQKHAGQVRTATERMRSTGDVFQRPQKGSFLEIIDNRDYLNEPVNRLAEPISQNGTDGIGTSIFIQSGGLYMSNDRYEIGQAGAVGPGAHAKNMTFNQIWDKSSAGIDVQQLARELASLREALSTKATDADHFVALGSLAAAEKAAQSGDGPKALEHLKSAGAWVWDIGTKIGIGVATAAAKSALGI